MKFWIIAEWEVRHPNPVELSLAYLYTCVRMYIQCKLNKYFEFKNSWVAGVPKLELLAVQWLSSNLCKVAM